MTPNSAPAVGSTRRRALWLAAGFAIVLVACSPSASAPVHTTLYVVGSWGGDEQRAFQAMVRPWEQQSGNTVAYEGTRDPQVLADRVSDGQPPDLAELGGLSQLEDFARAGKLVVLDAMESQGGLLPQYGRAWLDLGSSNGHLFALPIKAALSDVLWYDPKVLGAPGMPFNAGAAPTSWTALTAMADALPASGAGNAPWCLGLESGVTSGASGAAWIQAFLLRTAGPAAYAEWSRGRLQWTDRRMVEAWQRLGDIVAHAYGGKDGVLTTNFIRAGDPLFSNPPGCYLFHESAGFGAAFLQDNPTVQAGSDYTFAGFPDMSPLYASAEQVVPDLVGVFKDSPAARSLISYLATPGAQSIWVKRGGALSANRQVPMSAYPDPLSQAAGRILIRAAIVVANAQTLLPPAVQAAFFKGVVDYVTTPSSLSAILARLNAVEAEGASPAPSGS